MSGEILALRLNTIHNLYFYLELMAKIREAISQDRLIAFRKEFYELYKEKEFANQNEKENSTLR